MDSHLGKDERLRRTWSIGFAIGVVRVRVCGARGFAGRYS